MAYFAHRFGDPLTYVRAHGKLFGQPWVSRPLPPDPDKIASSRSTSRCTAGLAGGGVAFVRPGRREAFKFAAEEQAFSYIVSFATVRASPPSDVTDLSWRG